MNVYKTLHNQFYINLFPTFFTFCLDDDDHGIQLTSLAHNVDEALLRYDIDTKTCLARTMCSEYQKRADDKDTTGRLSRGILENIAE